MAAAKTLPSPTTSFVGRGAELAWLEQTFAEGARLVTLLGPPGIGKSRLALRHAELCRAAGGRFICDLVETTDADGLCAALSRTIDAALGAEARGGDRAAELGVSLEALGDALIVLDNFERLVGFGPETIGRWLKLSASTRFLVTSRERLRLAGERIHDLGPLSLPGADPAVAPAESVQLFVERARAVRPHFVLSPENTAGVTAIVQALDGIPLAIELGASRMAVLSPSQLLDRMSRRFEVLSAGIRDPAARQRTLREAIDASWGMLEPCEQDTLEQISVFRGGFSLEAAEAVADLTRHPGAPPLLDVLESLAGKSLLFTRPPAALPDQVRFGLYLSIRDYAAERLEASGRAGEIGDRHAAHFLAAATAWSAATEGPAGIEPLQRLTLDMENLIAVHHFLLGPSRAGRTESRDGALLAALTLESVLTRWGPVATLRSMLEDALGGAATIEPSLRMRGLHARANASYLLGRLEESRADFDAALEIAKKARDRRMKGIIGAGIGAVLREQGRLKEAARWLSDSITQLRACGARRWEVRARTSLGFIYTVTGKGDEARAQHEEAIALLRDEDDREQEAISFISLSLLSIVEGRLDEAAAHLEEARARMQQPSPPALEAACWRTVAILRQEQGRLDEARASAEASISIARALGNDRLEGFTLFHLGTIHGEMGDLVESRAALERATALLRRVGDVRAEVLFTAALAAVRARLGDLVASARLFESIEGRLEDPVDAMLGAAIGLYRAELDLERAARSSDPRAAGAAIAAARAAIVAAGSAGGGQPLIPGSAAARSQHVRVALRMLERLLTERHEAGVPSAREKVLVVAPDARWCRLPDGTEVAFKRGRALRLMLVRLFDERLRAPGRALPIADLFASGWPGERASADALENRVYVGISRLRKLGFRDLLQSRDDGFLLDPDVPSYRADKPF